MKTSFEVVGELTMDNIHLREINQAQLIGLSDNGMKATAAKRRLENAVTRLDNILSLPIRSRKNDDFLYVKDEIEQALKSIENIKKPDLPF